MRRLILCFWVIIFITAIISCVGRTYDGKCVELVDGSKRTGLYIDHRGSQHIIRMDDTGGLVKVPYTADFIVIECPEDE